ncbi:MAG: regulator of sirC expression with transglutaminase-like and TPR domain [Myxococcota bacterium]|jgi:regulator of sirC expression with transglutaminase-like and TPR domain
MKLVAARALHRERFAKLVARDSIPLDRACQWIAAEERPTPWPNRPVDSLDRIAAELHIPEGSSPFDAVARLNLHLFDNHGFCGDAEDYYAPRNSCLDQVMHRRSGQPILLSVVYMEVARRCGVRVHGVGFPGHFLVMPQVDGEPFFVDPFQRGRIYRTDQLRQRLVPMLDAPADADAMLRYTAPVSNRAIVTRICANLKRAWLRRGDLEGALRASERLLLLHPERAQEHHDRAVLLSRLGRHLQAEQALSAYLAGVESIEC